MDSDSMMAPVTTGLIRNIDCTLQANPEREPYDLSLKRETF